jgi:hypothetical protein
MDPRVKPEDDEVEGDRSCEQISIPDKGSAPPPQAATNPGFASLGP